MKRACCCLFFVVVAVVPAAAQVDQARAAQYFKEAQALCERDGGITWAGYVWQGIPADEQGVRGRLFMHDVSSCPARPRADGSEAGAAAPAKNNPLPD